MDTFADADFTWEKYEEAYNNELANDLGNLVQRLATLVSKNNVVVDLPDERGLTKEYLELMDGFRFSNAFDLAWEKIQGLNRRIDNEKPWSLAKEGKTEELSKCLSSLVIELLDAVYELAPFLPNACERIFEIFTNPIEPPKVPLFPKN